MVMLTAEQIRSLRLKMGVTITRFAADLGVTEHAVRRWEKGERHPKWSIMAKLNEWWDEHMRDSPSKRLQPAG